MSPVVDTIVHFFEPPRADCPHLGTAAHHGLAALPPEDLFPLMDKAGVDKAIQVTSGTMGFDNRYSLEIAARHPDRIRVVARFDATGSDVAARLARLFAEPHVVGVRLTFSQSHGTARAALEDGRLEPFWRAAAEQRVPVEFYADGDGAHIESVLRRHPNVHIMLDHIGVGARLPAPQIGWDPASVASWKDLFRLAPFENLTVRVSAIPELTGESYPFPKAQEILAGLHERFGAKRLMWGSNYPPSAQYVSYGDSVRWIREACRFLSPGDVELILGGNALRVMGITDWM